MRKRQLLFQGGFTLTELAIVLCVAGLILGCVWAVASTVLDRSQIRSAQEQTMTIVQNIRDFYGLSGASLGSVGSDVTSGVNKNRLIPIEMRVDQSDETGSSLRHAMGGTLQIYYASDDAFRLKFLGVPKTKCVGFIMGFPFLAPELAVKKVCVGSNCTTLDLSNVAHPSTDDRIPFSLVTAQSWCSGSTNEVDLDFYLRG